MSVAESVLKALEPYNLKSEGGGRYRCNSPFRSGADSMSFSITIEAPDRGAYYDHHANATGDEQKGSLFQLASKLGIETGAIPVANTKRTYTDIADYARSHGISAATLKHWQWQQVMYQSRPALEFNTRGGKRWRFLDGQKPHYISQKDYKKCWYGLFSKTIENRLQYGAPLIICNGEISTITGQEYGLAACCITAGENSIPSPLLEQLKGYVADIQDLNVIVALDCDPAGRTAALKIVDQLTSAGLNASAVDLGLSNGGDLADFCMLHGESTPIAIQQCKDLVQSVTLSDKPVVDIPKEHVLASGNGWIMVHANNLDKLPRVEWLIKGEIQKRGLTVLYGPSGVGKSFIAVDYAMRIAREKPVIYMAMEGEYGYHARLTAWRKFHKHDDNGNLRIVLGAIGLMSDDELTSFASAAMDVKPDLIVVDTMVHAMTGADENNTRDMNVFVQSCKRLMRTLDCALMIVHHTNKGGIIERGSGVLRGAADVMIRLSEDDGLITMECSKTKDFKAFAPRYLRLLPISTGLVDGDNEPVDTPVVVDAKNIIRTDDGILTANQQKVLETLALEVFEHGATLAELDETLPSLSRSSIHFAVSNLIKAKLVTQSAKRMPFTITDKGYEKLGMSNKSKLSKMSSDTSGSDDEENPVGQVGQAGQVGQTGQLAIELFNHHELHEPAPSYYENGL